MKTVDEILNGLSFNTFREILKGDWTDEDFKQGTDQTTCGIMETICGRIGRSLGGDFPLESDRSGKAKTY